jgi:hypothetical protein
MPHYKGGAEAKIGDVVKGKGYNVKDADGQLKEIVGTVVGITPDSMSCNIQVAHVVYQEAPAEYAAWANMYAYFSEKGVTGCGPQGGTHGTPKVMARVSLEYGECRHFEKII